MWAWCAWDVRRLAYTISCGVCMIDYVLVLVVTSNSKLFAFIGGGLGLLKEISIEISEKVL